MQFHDATSGDAPLRAALNKRLIEDEGHRNSLSIEQLASRMSLWLVSEYRATVFTLAEKVVGYALFRQEPDHIYIRQFFVVSEHRRKGLGRAAVEWLRCHEWAGTPRVRLDVLVGNGHGIAFWRALGFTDYCLTMEATGGSLAYEC